MILRNLREATDRDRDRDVCRGDRRRPRRGVERMAQIMRAGRIVIFK